MDKNDDNLINTKKDVRKKWGIFFGVFTFLLLFGFSFAAVLRTLHGTKNLVLVSSDLQLYLNEENNLTDIVQGTVTIPVADFEGLKTESYKFSLINEGKVSAGYTIYLVENENTTMPTYALRYNLSGLDGELNTTDNIENLEVVEGKRVLYSSLIPRRTTQNFELRVWLGVQAGNDAQNKVYSVKIQVDATQIINEYYEEALNGCDPVLGDNLVPVTIANDGTVTRVNLQHEWYNYTKKQWANAVVLEDTAGTYNPGDVIPESDIESYFVWVPRYKYKIFNDGNYTELTSLNPDAPQTIEIEFESKDTPVSSGTTKDEWLSHPAFQAFDTNGFWVGKFESGYRDATSTTAAQVNVADATKLVIKPNTYSWRNNTVGNMFKTSYDYLRDNESHMMKNTEWGAVAYLSHSQYGINNEIYINNNNTYLTGCGGDSASAANIATCTNAYGSKSDGIYNQTTTGNISGVFDMSGGAYEYVMGYNTSAGTGGGSSGITSLYGDFFTNSRWDKYYDKYVNASTSYTTYNQRILGDATGEMGPFASGPKSSWYDDYAYFVRSSSPWFLRGGNSGNTSNAGAFYFSDYPGGTYTNNSFRAVFAL